MEVKNAQVPIFPKPVERSTVIPVQTKERPEPHNIEAHEKITKEMLINKIEKLNEFLVPTNTAIQYKLHEESGEYYVQVMDRNSDEVLREIPNKKFLDMYASLMGLIVDDRL